MADYIYLLQNRLTPAQWQALETVREVARTHTMPIFLVGGAVRDLSSGAPVRDLDFVAQGDVSVLAADLQQRGATVSGENLTFGSLYLTFRGGVRVELGPTLSVTYPKPAQPEVQGAAILDDLRRRDFTANAMAVSLNEGSYGLLLDPLNGTADIENRELRLVSAYGFIEQPATLLRAARLTERLGWSLEERTQTRYETSKEEGHIGALPDFDRGYELEEIFHEEDPPATLEHLRAEGWADALLRGLQIKTMDQEALDSVRDLTGQLESQGLHPDPSAVVFPLITAKWKSTDRDALMKAFARQGFVRQIEGLEGRSRELAGRLNSKAASQPSEIWRLLMDEDPEIVLYLAAISKTGAVHSKLKAFLKDWPQMRQRIPYALMQEMRITPDLPGYDKLLDDLFFALIDGKLETPEGTRAFLEPYSPPAPPQVSLRKRPAKAAKGRAKKVVEDSGPEESGADQASRTEEAAAPGSDNHELADKVAGKPEPTLATSGVGSPEAKRPKAIGHSDPRSVGKSKGKKRSAQSKAEAVVAPSAAKASAKPGVSAASKPAKSVETKPSAASAKKVAKSPQATKSGPLKKKAAAPAPGTTKAAPKKGRAVSALSKPVAADALRKGQKPVAKKAVGKEKPAKTASKAGGKLPAKKLAAKAHPPAPAKRPATGKKAAKKVAAKAKGRR